VVCSDGTIVLAHGTFVLKNEGGGGVSVPNDGLERKGRFNQSPPPTSQPTEMS
jgi:hypothetical protein